MTDSMIERVAKVIFLKEGRHKDVAWEDADKVLYVVPDSWGVETPRPTEYYRDIARAAIEALREPTEEMLTAGIRKQTARVPGKPDHIYGVADIYLAMLDAVLAQPPKPS